MTTDRTTYASEDVSATARSAEPDRPAESATAPLLQVRDLRVRFAQRGRSVHAVNGLSYELAPGRMLAIVGESGSGKSVGVRALMGLLPPSAQVWGSALFDGTELVGMPEREMRRHRGADIAMVFQDPARSLNPTMRIGSQITEAIRAHADIDRGAAQERAVELLRLVRLAAPEQRFFEYPHQLSGGMRQRVMIAIALAAQPRLLIADEATTSLDVTTQAQIMELLLELQQQLGMAVILISHDLGLAASYAQDVIVMYAGRAVEYASASTLFEHVRMPYTRALLGAIPLLEREAHTLLPVIPGQPPDLSSPPVDCPFRPRCASATEQCAEPPPFAEHEPGHWWACWHPTPDEGTHDNAGDGAQR
ncbi:ABC transporter ATP-binding protein [Saccharopolyspora sp. K220]|uniref:ABC transporter ATP-binding protein n=1 Tax=Saccharopolyspora soli TaxID=2926618 RepID=UPI001F582730|nr:ABC transporter ATP-binding protein [Saccharopolyspora soli]MCI2416529.1 ABC transporter ATP-binding protein [Saccharopolyspora soli]